MYRLINFTYVWVVKEILITVHLLVLQYCIKLYADILFASWELERIVCNHGYQTTYVSNLLGLGTKKW